LGVVDTSTVRIQSYGLFVSDTQVDLLTRNHLVAQGWIISLLDGLPLPDVSLFWHEKKRQSALSDVNGYFLVDSILYKEPLTLTLQKPDILPDTNKFILSYDAALVARHVVGLGMLTQAQEIAADVNQDDSVTVEDAVRIARYVVGFDSTYTFSTGKWLFNPTGLYFDSLTTDQVNHWFTGVLLGDVHGGWSGGTPGSNNANQQKINLQHWYGKGQNDFVTVPITLSGSGILSCDFEMIFNSTNMKLIDIVTTEKTKQFQVQYHQSQDGSYRIGLFSPSPVSGDCEILHLQFQVSNDWHLSQLEFRNIYINENPGQFDKITRIVEEENSHQLAFELNQNFPNPFNSETIVSLSLDTYSRVRIHIYNILGKHVITLQDSDFAPGRYWFRWDGCDKYGQTVSSGQYVIEVIAGEKRSVRKMKIIR
jgi:hypothetical protein